MNTDEKLSSTRKNLVVGSLAIVILMMTIVVSHTNILGNLAEFKLFKFSLLNPAPNKEDPFVNLTFRLEQKPNNFKLNYPNEGFIKQAAAEEGNDFDNANAYVVLDMETGDVLLEKDAKEKFPIASLTKVMTSTVALDLASPSEYFTVTKQAEKIIPTKIGVTENQKLKLEELLNAVLLTSANDAAEVVREGVDYKYNSDIFIRAMNKKAEFLGLSHSNFSNPQGFDSTQNYSSAEDLAILSHYALTNYPLIAEIAKKSYAFLPEDNNHKQYDLYNWNGLIGVYPGVNGLKIGNTDDAGKTTIVTSEREGKKILVVLLGAPSVLDRDLWASELLDQGFDKLAGLKPIKVTEEQLKEKYATWQY